MLWLGITHRESSGLSATLTFGMYEWLPEQAHDVYDGRLAGITSVGLNRDDSDRDTYVVSLWPLLLMEFEIKEVRSLRTLPRAHG